MEFTNINLPPKKKVTSFTNLVITVVVIMLKSISKISPKNRSACSKNLKCCFDSRSEKPEKKYSLRLEKKSLKNYEWAKIMSFLIRAESSFQLHELETLCIQPLRPSLCKQKKFVCQNRHYKSLFINKFK